MRSADTAVTGVQPAGDRGYVDGRVHQRVSPARARPAPRRRRGVLRASAETRHGHRDHRACSACRIAARRSHGPATCQQETRKIESCEPVPCMRRTGSRIPDVSPSTDTRERRSETYLIAPPTGHGVPGVRNDMSDASAGCRAADQGISALSLGVTRRFEELVERAPPDLPGLVYGDATALQDQRHRVGWIARKARELGQ